MPKKLISVVIPCFNEEEVIKETILRVTKLRNDLSKYDFELIFVDDGSKDHTRSILKKASQEDPNVKVLGFSRNFGHQIAVSAGLDFAGGDAVILMDADLQDPPEIVNDMISKWEEGYDVVYATRADRHGESKFKIITAKNFYRLLNKLSDIEIPLDTGDFRLMDKKVVAVLKNMPEQHRFIRGMVTWVGFKQTSVLYKRHARYAGESKYPLRKMISFAFDGILSFSSKPLQLSITLGMICVALSIAGIIYSIIVRIFTQNWVDGWATIIIAILFIGSIQLISIGILGEYIGRIYSEIKKRPLYIIDEKIGLNDDCI